MPAIIEPPPEPGARPRPLPVRLAWFVGLAAAGSLTTALVAYGLRSLL